MYPVILTAVATQHILEMQTEAARTAQARAARTRAAREGRSARLAWLFDLADRRAVARAAQDGADFCCPDYLLTGRCAVHTQAQRIAAGSSRRS